MNDVFLYLTVVRTTCFYIFWYALGPWPVVNSQALKASFDATLFSLGRPWYLLLITL